MLQRISISNYALIADLQMDFADGFGVITGETGAGKSIILGALGLVMGQRADSKSISEGEKKCVIEAEFDVKILQLEELFKNHDLDYEDGACVVRRELTSNGKSRSFVNDTPVGLAMLKELSGRLIDIHSQHENLLFNSNLFQLKIVDTVAQNGELRKEYAVRYKAYQKVVGELAALETQAAEQKADMDYVQFQWEQLSEARLSEGDELECLEEELNQLNHSEDIQRELSYSVGILDGEEQGALARIKNSQAAMRKLHAYSTDAEGLSERIESVLIELRDIVGEMEGLAERSEYNPKRQEVVEARVNELNTLLQKHHVKTLEELMAVRDVYEERLQRIDSYDEEIAALQMATTEAKDDLLKAAKKLSASRTQVKTQIEKEVGAQLLLLGIPHPRFEVKIEDLAFPVEHGGDAVEFLFAANKNQAVRPVSEVASGGEMSRLMLCIKALIASTKSLPTILFDEIDTGVSGEVADKMASIMEAMGKHMQVISITHLPQIAARGKVHYKVYKVDGEDRTMTHIRQLDAEERVGEIAQMLSGSTVSEVAMENARKLMINC